MININILMSQHQYKRLNYFKIPFILYFILLKYKMHVIF